MPKLIPVDGNPFGAAQPEPKLIPVEGNPFAQSGGATRQAAQPEPERESSMFDMFTGSDRTDADIERTPSLMESGILSDIPTGDRAKIALAAQYSRDPEELARIIKAQVPDAQIQYNKDAAGNVYPLIARNGRTAIINKPGFDELDALQFGSQAAAFTPAARVTGASVGALAKGAGAAAGTQAAIQGEEAALGGEFDVDQVALDAGTQGLFQAGEAGIRAAAPAVKSAASPLWSKIAERMGRTTDQAPPPGGAAPGVPPESTGLPATIEGSGRRDHEVRTPFEDMAKAMGAKDMQKILPKVMADPEVMRAADDLGVNVNPGVYSTSDIYREMENSLKNIPASRLSANEKELVRTLGQRADDLVSEYGGTLDKSALSADFSERMLGTVKTMEDEASAIYETFKEAIPGTLKVRAESTIDYLKGQIDELGEIGDLDPRLQKLYKSLTREGGANHALIDQLRKDVGASLKNQGPFKDASQNQLKRLYGTLTDDSLRAPEFMGLADEVKAAKELVKKRKVLEESLQDALGKDLSKSLMAELGTGVRNLTKGSPAKFDKVMSAVPEDMRQQVAISALNDVFAGGTRTSKDFSLTGFVSGYEALKRNARASEKLMQHIPDYAKRRLDSIYRVSKGLVELNKRDLNNPSGTGKAVVGAMNAPDGLLAKMYNVVRQGAAGAAMTSPLDGGAAGGAVGIYRAISAGKTQATEAADEMLSSPAFRDAMQRYAMGNTQAANGVMKRAKGYGKWLNAQAPAAKRSIARQGLIQYLLSSEQAEDDPNQNQ